MQQVDSLIYNRQFGSSCHWPFLLRFITVMSSAPASMATMIPAYTRYPSPGHGQAARHMITVHEHWDTQ